MVGKVISESKQSTVVAEVPEIDFCGAVSQGLTGTGGLCPES